MTAFELVFAMFGLLLGLSVAEVLGGFARTLKLRRKVRIGWLTPLLGVYVLLDLTTFWIAAYSMRELIEVSQLTLLVVLSMVGGYYLVATLIFPDDPAEWPDFDAWYDQHNRAVIGGVLAINLALFAVAVIIALTPGLSAAMHHAVKPHRVSGLASGIASLTSLLPFLLLIALFFVRARAVNVALLATLIGVWLLGAVAPLL